VNLNMKKPCVNYTLTLAALVVGLSASLAGRNESSGPVLAPHISEATKVCVTNGGLAKIDDAKHHMSVGDNSTDTYACEATCNNGGFFNVYFKLPRGAK
jgi:hypothetical protein